MSLPGVLVFLAGVAQAHDEPVHRPAGFFKDHREFLLVCLYHIPKETGKQVCFPVSACRKSIFSPLNLFSELIKVPKIADFNSARKQAKRR